jgi:hypothetical protein
MRPIKVKKNYTIITALKEEKHKEKKKKNFQSKYKSPNDKTQSQR